jgi:uncharacterized protein involved in tolerance to divalent cations
MAQPAHASDLQIPEGGGEEDLYQAEVVNADLIPVESNPAADKGEVLRAIADLCFSHTPGKFVHPHVIPYFLRAALPEKLWPKREKGGGDTTVQSAVVKRLSIADVPGYKVTDKTACTKYMSGFGRVYRNLELHPPTLEAQREPGPAPTIAEKKRWAAVQTLKRHLVSPYNDFRWTHNEIVEKADEVENIKKKRKTRSDTMPPFVKMVHPYNFCRILVVDPFTDTVQAKITSPHTALITGVHTLNFGRKLPECIVVYDDIPNGWWEREVYLQDNQTFTVSAEPLVEVQFNLFAIEFALQTEALSRPAPPPTMRLSTQKNTMDKYFVMTRCMPP